MHEIEPIWHAAAVRLGEILDLGSFKERFEGVYLIYKT